jgi:hypothetical protein
LAVDEGGVRRRQAGRQAQRQQQHEKILHGVANCPPTATDSREMGAGDEKAKGKFQPNH